MSELHDNTDGRITNERDGQILRICVDRPRKMNAFTPKMFRELAEALTRLEEDSELRAGLLYPEGPHFSAGLDLPQFTGMMRLGEPVIPRGLIDPFDLRAPRRTKPVVIAVRGVTFTLDLDLAMAADVAIAGDDCRFSQIEVRRGIMATGGATIRMIERAGWTNAMRWLLTGDEFGGAEALRMNLVSQVVPAADVVEAGMEIARRIAAAAPAAVLATRRNGLLALEQGRHAAIAELGGVNRRLSGTDDAAEGLAAFREKRDPRFEGR